MLETIDNGLEAAEADQLLKDIDQIIAWRLGGKISQQNFATDEIPLKARINDLSTRGLIKGSEPSKYFSLLNSGDDWRLDRDEREKKKKLYWEAYANGKNPSAEPRVIHRVSGVIRAGRRKLLSFVGL